MNDIEFYSKKNPKNYVVFFNKKRNDIPCPMCGIGIFSILKNECNNLVVIQNAVYSAGDDNKDASMANIYSYIAICNHCSSQQYFNAKAFTQNYDDEMAGIETVDIEEADE